MFVTQSELDRFQNFASGRIATGKAMTWDELFEEWQVVFQSPEERAASVAAVRQALEDFKAGDRGRLAEESLRELREKLNLDES